MPEEIEIEIEDLKKKYPEFFKDSAGVIEFALSEGTSSQIAEICLRNGVENEEKIEKVAYQITLVLLGGSLKEELTRALEKEVLLESAVAEKISLEANHLVFSQMPGAQPLTEPEKPAAAPPPPEEETTEEPPKPPGKDIYHELVE